MYLLNLYGISFNKKEMLAIKMADGLFDEGNKSQYLATGYFPHRSRLGYFLHWCDWMACISENDPLRVQFENNLKRQMSISK
ncbi:MAG: hypothetical protein KY428_07095, partial [Bacteroidetes bacterium]|nr:hypothetical protein [Bacteroidota bacterium]